MVMHIHAIIIEHEVHHLQCRMLSSAFLEVVYIITLGMHYLLQVISCVHTN